MTKKIDLSKSVWIGFFTYAGYDKLIIEATKEDCWKAMKREYYQWRKGWNGDKTWKEAKEYFGYNVIHASVGEAIEY